MLTATATEFDTVKENKTMKILNGLHGGMVMQRNIKTDECDILAEIECVGELSASYDGNSARIEREDGSWRLTGIPAGGPYTLVITDSKGSVSFDDIYVGDVWMLAGQSNMEGAGLMTDAEYSYEKNPDESVRAFYLDDRWDTARARLSEQWKNADRAVAEKFMKIRQNSIWKEAVPKGPVKDGVGPGLFFGLRMKEYTGVPQGLITCAFGGASLADWKPGNPSPEAYYPTFVRRFKACGSHVRGIFWYQGESETSESGAARFDANMIELVAAMRRDLGDEKLPFVQVQIGSHSLPDMSESSAGGWTVIREKQRLLGESIPCLATVPAIDCPRDDLIHLSAEGQRRIGKRGARAMAYLCGYKTFPAPEIESISIEPDPVRYFWYNILVRYRNLDGDLKAYGDNPMGFSITAGNETPYMSPYRGIANITLHGDTVSIRTELTKEQLRNVKLWYGAGLSCVCTITDGDGMPLPAFGPLKLSDRLDAANN